MLLGRAKHLHCLRESHAEKQAMGFPGVSLWFYEEEGELPAVCKKEGRERASRTAWGTEALFLGL